MSGVGMVLSFVAGMVLGCLLFWIARRGAVAAAVEKGKGEAAKDIAVAQEKIAGRDNEIAALKTELGRGAEERRTLAAQNAEAGKRISELETHLQQERRQTEEKLKILLDAKEQLKNEFQNLATQILEEKSQRFTAQNKENIENILTPLREQLGDFKKKVEDVYDKESRDRASLSTEITMLKQLNQKISQDAVALTDALKGDSKTQGNWGELVLERVLELSGLEKGREYDVQVHMHNEEGGRHLPDAIVHLPENRDVVIDAKVSLTAYERFHNAQAEDERAVALAAHILSVRSHTKELGVKGYHDLQELRGRTLDFVFMFIPVEAAFLTAMREDHGIFSEAFERNVIIVCPSTLLVTLRTVANIWRYEKQNGNAMDIAKRAGDLHDKFTAFVETLGDVGRALRKAQDSYDSAYKALATGRGNLVKRSEEFKKLGVKTARQLPQELVDQSENDDEEEQ